MSENGRLSVHAMQWAGNIRHVGLKDLMVERRRVGGGDEEDCLIDFMKAVVVLRT